MTILEEGKLPNFLYTKFLYSLWALVEPSTRRCGCEVESIDVSHLISTLKPVCKESAGFCAETSLKRSVMVTDTIC